MLLSGILLSDPLLSLLDSLLGSLEPLCGKLVSSLGPSEAEFILKLLILPGVSNLDCFNDDVAVERVPESP